MFAQQQLITIDDISAEMLQPFMYPAALATSSKQ